MNIATSPLLDPPPPVQEHPRRLAGLSIVLPCFDEAENVAAAIEQAAAAAAAVTDGRYEVIVVDDGSQDGTADIASAFAARDPRVRLVVHPSNRGYGAALRSGIAAARQPWVFITDADLQFDLGQIGQFVPETTDADLLIGWRIARQDPLHRRLNAAAWNALVRCLFRLPVRDIDCAFKLIRRELLAGLDIGSEGATVSTELVAKALAAGARLHESGVRHRPRIAGKSSGASPRVVLRALRELAVLRLRFGVRRTPVASGTPGGGPGKATLPGRGQLPSGRLGRAHDHPA